MSEPTEAIQAHWTRAGVLGRIEAALAAAGHDPQCPPLAALSAIDHLHTGGLATTKDQAAGITLTAGMRVLDIGCGIGGPARHLASTFGCRVDGIDLTPEFIAVGQELTKRTGLAARVVLREGDGLALDYPDQAFDVVWCQNVTMHIADKDRFLAGVRRVLKPGGVFTSTEFSSGPGGEIVFPVQWAYDGRLSFLDSEAQMRERLVANGFEIVEMSNYSDVVIGRMRAAAAAAMPAMSNHLVYGDDTPERQRGTLQNLDERRIIYWMIVAVRA